MATLTITTNTKNLGDESLKELLIKLSQKISKAIKFPEEVFFFFFFFLFSIFGNKTKK